MNVSSNPPAYNPNYRPPNTAAGPSIKQHPTPSAPQKLSPQEHQSRAQQQLQERINACQSVDDVNNIRQEQLQQIQNIPDAQIAQTGQKKSDLLQQTNQQFDQIASKFQQGQSKTTYEQPSESSSLPLNKSLNDPSSVTNFPFETQPQRPQNFLDGYGENGGGSLNSFFSPQQTLPHYQENMADIGHLNHQHNVPTTSLLHDPHNFLQRVQSSNGFGTHDGMNNHRNPFAQNEPMGMMNDSFMMPVSPLSNQFSMPMNPADPKIWGMFSSFDTGDYRRDLLTNNWQKRQDNSPSFGNTEHDSLHDPMTSMIMYGGIGMGFDGGIGMMGSGFAPIGGFI